MTFRFNSLLRRQARRALLLPLLCLAAAAFLATPAAATTTINHQFIQATIDPGDTSVYRITITNDDTGSTLTSAKVTVVLQPQITIASPLTIADSCNFTVNQPLAAGGSTIELIDGTIPAGLSTGSSSCTFDVNVTASAAGNWINTIPDNTISPPIPPGTPSIVPDATTTGYVATTTATGVLVANATPANATLSVNSLSSPTGSKNFSPSPAYAGDAVTLTITLNNPNAAATIPLTTFTDTLPDDGAGHAMMVNGTPSVACSGNNAVNGTVAAAADNKSVTLTGGAIGESGACVLTVPVTVTSISGVSQSFNNDVTTDAIGNTRGLPSAGFNRSLTVNTPIQIQKSFTTNPIPVGQPSLMTLTITNHGSVNALDIANFSDDLTGTTLKVLNTASTPVAATADPSVVCTGSGAVNGTLATTPDLPDTTITLANAIAGPAGHCTIQAYVTSDYDGTHLNTTGTVDNPTHNFASTAASASLTAKGQLVVLKTVSVGSVAPGQWTDFTVTIENFTGVQVDSVQFKDLLPKNGSNQMLVVDPSTLGAIGTSGIYTTSAGCQGGTWTGLDAFGTSTGNLPVSATDAGLQWSAGSIVAGSGAAPGICTIHIRAQLPASAPSGLGFTNQIPYNAVTGNRSDNGNPVSNDDTQPSANVTTLDAIAVGKSFAPNPIAQGGLSTLSITIYNRYVSAVSAINLTDNLPAGITLAANPAPTNSCGGTLQAYPSDTQIVLTGGALAARPDASQQTSCVITVKVTGSAVGSYQNVIQPSDFTSSGGSISGNATATLGVTTGITGSKAFAPLAVTPGGNSRATITINNTSSGQLTNLSIDDDNFGAGLTVANPANPASSCAGSPTLVANPGTARAQMLGARLNAGASCTFSFDVATAAASAGPWTNTIAAGKITTAEGPANTSPIAASLTKTGASIGINKSFNPVIVTGGQASVLTIDVVNNFGVAIHNVHFTDTFPTGIQVHAVPNATTTCAGAVVSAIPGDGKVVLSGATLAANATCHVYVTTTSVKFLNLTNTIPASSVTSSEGYTNLAATSASLSTLQGLGVMKTFSPAYIAADQTSQLQITLVSTFDPNAVSPTVLTGVSLTDSLPTGVSIAATPKASTTCSDGSGGNATVTAAADAVTLSGATIPPGATCLVEIDVTASNVGHYDNTIDKYAVTTTQGVTNQTATTARLNVVTQPTISKAFATPTARIGQATRLTVTISNGSGVALSGAALTDMLPAGLAIAGSANAGTTCSNAIVTANPGDDQLIITGASLLAGGTCTFYADVVSNTAGSYPNSIAIGSLVDDQGLTNPGQADATLTVLPPASVTKHFAPASIAANATSTLTITLSNSSASPIALTSDLVDALPGNVVVANTLNLGGTCDQAKMAATAGGTTVSYGNGGTIPPGSCTITVDVTSSVAGTYVNLIAAGQLQTSAGNNQDPAVATLGVDHLAPPTMDKGFVPETIFTGASSALTINLHNDNATDIHLSADFVDALPGNLAISGTPTTTCSGALVFDAGSLTLPNGSTIPVGGCSITATVTSAVAGSYTNTIAANALLSDAGSPPLAATAGLVVEALTPPTVIKSLSPNVINPGGISTLTITLGNSNAADIALTSDLIDTLPANVVIAAAPNLAGTCAGSKAASAGGTTVTYASGATIPSGSCTIVVDVTSAISGGPYTNTIVAGDLKTSAGNNGADATAPLFVNPPQPPSINKTFTPSLIPKNGTSTLTLSLGNGNAAATTLSADLVDALPAGVVIAAIPNVQKTCPDAVAAAAGGTTVTYANGATLPAGGCSINVDVTSAAPATYTNTIGVGALSTGYGSNNVSTVATLQVVDWPTNADLALTKGVAPGSGVAGDTQTVTLTWRNTNSASPTQNMYQCAVADPLPTAAFDETTVVPISTPAGYTFNRTGNTVAYTRSDGTTPCETTAQTATFSVKLKSDVVTGSTYTNVATATAKTLPSNDGNAGNAGTLSKTASANVSVTAANISTKTVVSTSQNFTDTGDANKNANPPVAIGETVTYAIDFSLPPGVTRTVILADEVTTGITDTALISATLARSSTGLGTTSNPGNINGAAVNTPVDITSAASTSGNEFQFAVGNVTNADTGNASFTLTVTLRIANVAANTRGHAIIDQGRLRYQDASAVAYSLITASTSVQVALPKVAVGKTALPAAPVGGDTVTYTLTITNTAGSNVTAGYDWTFTDVLPATLTSPGGFTVTANPNGRAITGAFIGNTLNGTIDRLDAGESITVQYTAVVATGTPFGSTITNAVTVRTTTIPTGNADADYERTGDATGANDLYATTSASVTTGTPTLTKTVQNAQTWYAIGDVVNYRLTIGVPIGTTSNFVATDVLPAGLTYVAGSAVVSTTAGVTTPASGTITPAIAGNTLTFTIGNIAATYAGSVYIDFNAQVANVRTNQHNASLTNSASATYGGGLTLPSTSATPQVTVGEPNLTMTKTILSGAAGSDAGNTVRWRVTVANAASRVTAYQQTISDLLPNHLYHINVVSVTASGGNVQPNNAGCALGTPVSTTNAAVTTTTNNNDTLTLANLCMASGATLTIVYDTTVMDTAVAAEVLTNTARATYASQWTGTSGSAVVRDGVDPSTDDDTDPASGACNGTTTKCNNYNESASGALTIGAAIAIDKQADKTTAVIGETVTYTVRVSVIEGVTPNVIVTDVLPAGLTYVSHAINLGHIGMTLGNAAYNTRLGSGQTVQFNLGNVGNPTNASTADDYVDIAITARVDNIVANQKDVVLKNGEGTGAGQTTPTVKVQYGATTLGYDYNTTTGGFQGRPLTIAEPALTIAKAAAPIAQSLGDEIVFTLTIQHDGSNSDATAFDIDVSDVLPAGLTYIPGSASPAEPAVAGNTLTFPTIASLTMAAGSTVITYRARVDLTAVIGSPLTNNASVTWKSQTGATGGASSGRSGPLSGSDTLNDYRSTASSTVTPTASAFIDAQKRVAIVTDNNGNGSADPGDTLRYTITLTNQGSTAATNVAFTDSVPADTTYADNLTTNTGTATPVGSSPISGIAAAIGTLAAGASATIQFDVTVAAGTPVGTVISNQGRVDSDQTIPKPTDADGDPSNGDQPTTIVVGGGGSSSNLYASKFVSLLTDTAPLGSVSPGDTMRYRLQVTNTGGATLTNVALADAIPTGLTLTGTPSATQGGITGTTTLTWTIGTLTPGQTVLASFDVVIGTFAGSKTFANQGSVTADGGVSTLTDGNGSPLDGNQPTIFDAVTGAGAAPQLDVQKRWALAADNDGNGVASHNDLLRYTLIVTNNGSATASNVRVNDPAPGCAPTASPCTSIVAGSATTNLGVVVAEGPPLSVNLGDMAPGQAAVVSWLVTANAANGNIVSNQATVTANNVAGSTLSDDDGVAGNGRNPTLTPLAGGGTGSATPANLQKSIFATDQPGSAGSSVLIGEVVTWHVSVDVPAGTTRELVLGDLIPADLSLVAGSARLSRGFTSGLTATTNPDGINSAISGSFVALSTSLTTTTNGDGSTTLTLPFGNVINSAASAATYTLEYQTQVANVAANVAGRTRSNSATASFRNALDQAMTLSPVSATVTEIEPQVAVTLADAPGAILTSGGTVSFTATLSNTAAAAPAYDTHFVVPLPTQYVSAASIVVTSPLNCATGIAQQVSGTPPTITVDIATLPAGCLATVAFAAATASSLTGGSTISTTGTATWTSLPGTASGERTGTGIAPDTYVGQASTSLLVGDLALTKELLSAQARYAIGDSVDYRLRLSVPANFGPIANVKLSDLLPAGLLFTGTTGVTIPPGISSSKAPSALSGTGASGDPLLLDLGTVSNASSAGLEVVVDYGTRVTDTLNNQDGVTWPNHGTLVFDDPTTGSPVTPRATPDVQVTVGEPHLAPTLVAVTSTIGLNAGATVTYEYVASNDGTTVMHDLVLTDTLPTELTNVQGLTVIGVTDAAPAGDSTPTAGITLNGTGTGAWSSSPFDLGVGDSVTIRYTVTIGTAAQPAQPIQNTLIGTYTSRAGSDANERSGSSNGPLQSDDTQLDNYRADVLSPTLTIGDPISIDKTFVPTTTTQYAVGAPVKYRLTIGLAQGTVQNVTITDTLPDGVDLVSAHDATFGNGGITLGGSATPIVAQASGHTLLTWSLGTITNPADGSTSDDFVTLDIDGRIANALGNQAGTTLGNNASLDFTDGEGNAAHRDFDADVGTPGVQPLNLTVVEPDLVLTKSVTSATMSLGDTVQFSLLVDHLGTSGSDAYDTTVVDVLPLGLTYVAGSATIVPTVSTLGDGRQQLGFALGTLTRTTDNLTIGYRATVDTSAAVGSLLTNTATLTWASQSGATGAVTSGRTAPLDGGDTLNDYLVQSNASVTPNTDAIYTTKTVALVVDTAANGVADAGDTLEYTVTLHNGVNTVSNVRFTDPVPVNTTYVGNSLTLNGSTVANAGSASQLVVQVGSLASGATAAITFRVTVNAGVVAGAVISNQGTVDSDQTVPKPTDSDGDPGNGDQPTLIGVGLPAGPALSMIKTVAMSNDRIAPYGSITVGDEVTYTIVVTNTGSLPLTNVSLTDTIPSAVTITGVSGNAGYSGANVTASLGPLAPGASVTVTISGDVQQAGTFANQATVTSTETGSVPSDNDGDPGNGINPTVFAAAAPNTAGAPALTLVKSGQVVQQTQPDGLLHPGDVIQYTLVLTNSGSAPASSLTLNDAIPAGTSYLSATTSQGAIVTTQPQLSVNIGTATPGATITVILQVRVTAAIGATITNTGSFACAETGCPGTSNPVTMNVVAANVFDPPSGTKTVTANGSTLTWRMVWINSGNAVANQVQVVDPLASELTYLAGSLVCDARGTSTVTTCMYDAATQHVIYQGSIAADYGLTTEATATNEVVITFQTTLATNTQQTRNTAAANWDRNGNGLIIDDQQAGQAAVQATTTYHRPSTSIPALGWPMLLVLSILAGLLGIGARRSPETRSHHVTGRRCG